MTARTPLYYDGTDLVEMSASEIVEYQRQAIFQYASNPSVTLTQVAVLTTRCAILTWNNV